MKAKVYISTIFCFCIAFLAAIMISTLTLNKAAVTTANVDYWTNYAEAPSQGNGSKNSPYQMESAENLAWLSLQYKDNALSQANYLYVELVSDIDLSGHMWYPIGKNTASSLDKFNGVFDGKGHVISNLFTQQTDQTYVGFFGYILGSSARFTQIKNVEFKNVFVDGYRYVGAMAGIVNRTMVDNVKVSGVVQGQRYVGGLMGYVWGNNTYIPKISNCVNYAKVVQAGNTTNDPDYGAGGILGSGNGFVIEKCVNYGMIEGYIYGGGIAAYIYTAEVTHFSISECVNFGMVKVGNKHAGGIISFVDVNNQAESVLSVTKSKNYGLVEAARGVGGVIGYANRIGVLTVSNCQNEGNLVSTEEAALVGGIIGYFSSNLTLEEGKENLTLSQCTSNSLITANNTSTSTMGMAGLVGYINSGKATIEDCKITAKFDTTSQKISPLVSMPNAEIEANTSIKSCLYDVVIPTVEIADDNNARAGMAYREYVLGGSESESFSPTNWILIEAGGTKRLAFRNDYWVGPLIPNDDILGYIKSQGYKVAGTGATNLDPVSTTFPSTSWLDHTEKPSGNGTAESPYLIATPENLAWISNRNNSSIIIPIDTYLKLTADIDLAGHLWVPFDFRGTFDGNGKVISNLFAEMLGSSTSPLGLFGNLRNSEVKNLDIANVNMNQYSANEIRAGALAGNATNVVVENVRTFGKIDLIGLPSSLMPRTAGGLFGKANNATIKNVQNFCNIAAFSAGGIIGGTSDDGEINLINCKNFGDIKGTYYAGGIFNEKIANAQDLPEQSVLGSIKNCENYGNISGGVVAGISNSIIPDLQKCSNKGSASGGTVAGISGYSDSNTSKSQSIYWCINYGNITTTNRGFGISFGSGGNVSNCINYGKISSSGTSYSNYISGISTYAKTVVDCTNYGLLSGVGGRIGGVIYGDCEVAKNLYNYGNIVSNITGVQSEFYGDIGGIACAAEKLKDAKNFNAYCDISVLASNSNIRIGGLFDVIHGAKIADSAFIGKIKSEGLNDSTVMAGIGVCIEQDVWVFNSQVNIEFETTSLSTEPLVFVGLGLGTATIDPATKFVVRSQVS